MISTKNDYRNDLELDRKFIDERSHNKCVPVDNLQQINSTKLDTTNILSESSSKSKLFNTRNSLKPANLTERFRQWSIMETDEMYDSFTNFRLDDVIADAISLVSRIATPRGVEISFKPNHEAIVYADQDMIYSTAQNVISNAVKFSQKGETVKISSKVDQNTVVASISNSGIGISEKLLQQLFQTHPDPTNLGTVSEMVAGIELLLSQRFAERNNGDLSFISEDGEGVTFTLTLPKVIPNKHSY